MIVMDTNVLAYLLLPAPHAARANRRARKKRLAAEQGRLRLSAISIATDGKAHSNYDPGIGDSFRTTAVADVDLRPFWNAVRCPVLVTRGALSDLLLPETYSAMLQKPGVSGVEIPGVGHAPMFLNVSRSG